MFIWEENPGEDPEHSGETVSHMILEKYFSPTRRAGRDGSGKRGLDLPDQAAAPET